MVSSRVHVDDNLVLPETAESNLAPVADLEAVDELKELSLVMPEVKWRWWLNLRNHYIILYMVEVIFKTGPFRY